MKRTDSQLMEELNDEKVTHYRNNSIFSSVDYSNRTGLVVSPSKNVGSVKQNTTSNQENIEVYNPEKDVAVAVFRSQSEKVEEIPLEQYVAGVVASEMPAEFELEALKLNR